MIYKARQTQGNVAAMDEPGQPVGIEAEVATASLKGRGDLEQGIKTRGRLAQAAKHILFARTLKTRRRNDIFGPRLVCQRQAQVGILNSPGPMKFGTEPAAQATAAGEVQIDALTYPIGHNSPYRL